MREGFFGSQKRGPALYATAPHCQCGGKATAHGDPARGDDRQLRAVKYLLCKPEGRTSSMDMATRLDPLSDDDIRAGFFGHPRRFQRTNLVQDKTPRLLHTLNDIRNHIPEEAESGHAEIETTRELRLEQSWLCRCWNQVDGKGLVSRSLHCGNFLGDQAWSFPHHAQYSIATRICYSCRQFPTGNTPHPRKQDGHLAS